MGGRVPVDEETITVTGTVQQAAWRDRTLPPVEQVRPGIWSVPTPFPRSPLRYVLAYLIETPGGLAIVDTGWPDDESWDGLVAGIRETGHEVTDIKAILVTHFHADHVGLASRLREVSGAWIGMHELDAQAASRFSSLAEFAEADGAWLKRRGVPSHEAKSMLPPPIDRSPGPGKPDRLLKDGDRPLGARGPLRAVWTPGHTPGHLCFAHEPYDVLLTGDHVLPRISPNINPSAGITGDILGDYLGSLAALADAEVAEVLPAHEYRFRGLPARVRQLQAHHDARLREVLAIVDDLDGCTTAAVAERLTWSRPWDQNLGMVRRSAIGETYAHLVHLERCGLLRNAAAAADQADRWHLTGAR